MTVAQQKFIASLMKKYTENLKVYINADGLTELDRIEEEASEKSMTKEDASEAINSLIHFDKEYFDKDAIKESGRIKDSSVYAGQGWAFDYAAYSSRAKCRTCNLKIGPPKEQKEEENLRVYYWHPNNFGEDSVSTYYYHPKCLFDYLTEKPCTSTLRINDRYDLKVALNYHDDKDGKISDNDKKKMKKAFKAYFKEQNKVYKETHNYNKILGSWLKK